MTYLLVAWAVAATIVAVLACWALHIFTTETAKTTLRAFDGLRDELTPEGQEQLDRALERKLGR